MIKDKALKLDDAFSIAGATNYMQTDYVVDLQQARTLGGEELFMIFECTETPTPDDGTPRFQFWAVVSNAVDHSSGFTCIGATQMFGNGLTPAVPQISQTYHIPLTAFVAAGIEPTISTARLYLGAVYYNGTELPLANNYDAGEFRVYIVQSLPTARLAHYPAGFGVL